jgi:predicted  nucleic acid-binding Zn-ribbon protein
VDKVPANGLRKLEELEATVRRAAGELQRLTAERDTALAEAEKLRCALQERGETLRRLESQLMELETERAEVRGRIERLLAQIDSMSEAKQ